MEHNSWACTGQTLVDSCYSGNRGTTVNVLYNNILSSILSFVLFFILLIVT